MTRVDYAMDEKRRNLPSISVLSSDVPMLG
jgi:hypothetical protein